MSVAKQAKHVNYWFSCIKLCKFISFHANFVTVKIKVYDPRIAITFKSRMSSNFVIIIFIQGANLFHFMPTLSLLK